MGNDEGKAVLRRSLRVCFLFPSKRYGLGTMFCWGRHDAGTLWEAYGATWEEAIENLKKARLARQAHEACKKNRVKEQQ